MVTGSLRLQNACKVLAGIDTLLTHPLRGDAQSRCKHFTSVSPDRSGHFPPTVGAPMLGRSPLADMVPSKQAPTPELWIRQSRFESWRGNSPFARSLVRARRDPARRPILSVRAERAISTVRRRTHN